MQAPRHWQLLKTLSHWRLWETWEVSFHLDRAAILKWKIDRSVDPTSKEENKTVNSIIALRRLWIIYSQDDLFIERFEQSAHIWRYFLIENSLHQASTAYQVYFRDSIIERKATDMEGWSDALHSSCCPASPAYKHSMKFDNLCCSTSCFLWKRTISFMFQLIRSN